MWKKLSQIFCVAVLSILFNCNVEAQDRSSDWYYGNGVHQFNRGQYHDAIQSMNSAIATGSNDPRPYIFRGLAQKYTGNTTAAQADFYQGAMVEARTKKRSRALSRSLERVQGSVRMEIEKARKDARYAYNNPVPVAPVVNSGIILPQGQIIQWPATVVPTPNPVIQTQGVEIIEPGQEITPRPSTVTPGLAQPQPIVPTPVPDNSFDQLVKPGMTPPMPEEVILESPDKMAKEAASVIDSGMKPKAADSPFPMEEKAKDLGELIPATENPVDELIDDPFSAIEKPAQTTANTPANAAKTMTEPGTQTLSEPLVDSSVVNETPLKTGQDAAKPMENPIDELNDDPFANESLTDEPMKKAPMEDKPLDEPMEKAPTSNDDPFADTLPPEEPMKKAPMEDKPVEEPNDDPFADTPPAEQPMEKAPMEKAPLEEKPVEDPNDDPFADTPPAEEPMEEKAPIEEPVEESNDDPFADNDDPIEEPAEEVIDDPFSEEPNDTPPAPPEESDPDDPFG